MRPTPLQLSLTGLAALFGACGEETICTNEARIAVRVHVTSPDNLPIDRVTAQQSHEIECWFSSITDDSGADRTYRCTEQGGGEYTIRAYSGDDVWTATAHIDANECHTTEIKDVDLVLDPKDAKPRERDRDEDADEDEH